MCVRKLYLGLEDAQNSNRKSTSECCMDRIILKLKTSKYIKNKRTQTIKMRRLYELFVVQGHVT